jgi:hypothetical protein
VAENFGGPVWHASGRGKNLSESRRIALDGLRGVGDVTLGQWIDEKGMGRGVVHVQRRLTQAERDEFGVPEPFDIRGTEEQARRIAVVLAEAPYLRKVLA